MCSHVYIYMRINCVCGVNENLIGTVDVIEKKKNEHQSNKLFPKFITAIYCSSE